MKTNVIDFEYKNLLNGKWEGTKEELNQFLEELNLIDPEIKYTMEVEDTEFSINYLDLKINRKLNELKFSMFQKAIAANPIIPANSFTSKKTLRGIIVGEAKRYLRLSDFPEQDLNHLAIKFKERGYNVKLVKDIMEGTIKGLKKPKDQVKQNKTKSEKPRIILDFMGENSNNISRELNKVGYQLVSRNRVNLEGKFANKFKEKSNLGKSVVYKIDCECGDSYIGETSFDLKKRVGEHYRDVKKERDSNMLATHRMQTGHNIKFESARTLQQVTGGELDRKIVESLRIQAEEPELNLSKGTKLRGNWSKFI